MTAEQARDRYDAAHYGTARTIGQVVGTGAQIAVLGPTEGLVNGGVRIAEATPLIAREIGMLGGAGALTGVGGQAVSDVIRGRPGSVGDYLGAATGGGAGALLSRGGLASYAGALDGGVTSMAQDLFNGRAPSIHRAREAALGGGVMGTVGGLIGRRGADILTRKRKEQLGEDFSRLRTWARGDKTIEGAKRREHLQGGGYTYPDQRTVGDALIESKFGLKARLSNRQRQAYNQLPNYRIDHGLPRDVGAILGLPLAQFGYQAVPDYVQR